MLEPQRKYPILPQVSALTNTVTVIIRTTSFTSFASSKVSVVTESRLIKESSERTQWHGFGV